MTKEKITEFLFNEKKHGIEKFLLLILGGYVVIYLTAVFGISLFVIYITLLTLVLVMAVIKIAWYSKKKNAKTRVNDWIGITFCLIVLIAILFLFYQEEKLENAVYDVIEERAEPEDISIEFIDEMETRENYIVVGYTIEGDNTKYLERYHWRDGELIQDSIREIKDVDE